MEDSSWIFLNSKKEMDVVEREIFPTNEYSQTTQVIGTCVAVFGTVLILLSDFQ